SGRGRSMTADTMPKRSGSASFGGAPQGPDRSAPLSLEETMLKRMPPNGKKGNHRNGSRGKNEKNGKNGSRVKELPKITIHTDTREILAHAAKEKRDDYFIVDVDAHVTKLRSGRKSSIAWTATSIGRWRAPSRIAAAHRRACSTPRPAFCTRTCLGAFRTSSGSPRAYPADGPMPR